MRQWNEAECQLLSRTPHTPHIPAGLGKGAALQQALVPEAHTPKKPPHTPLLTLTGNTELGLTRLVPS